MKIEFDQEKSEKNRLQRGLPFEIVNDFAWESSLIWPDVRQNYGEDRLCAIGYIGKRLHHLTFTLRGDTIRIISLRKANYREISRYAKA